MSDIPTGPFSDSVMDDSSGIPQRRQGGGDRPELVGPYRILELLGEGGMGEVYKAERREPIRQTVAVKIIKLGFHSREIIGRFESERQSLALMDHPGIAKVLDAGTTDSGRPYFVMEFVAGKPITQFCDENRLSIDDRLKLFMDVCDAIAHAHSKAIIHRDIKPSNVLAYTHDGVFAAKVIDFGIAKALSGDRMSDQTYYTARGQAIGTYDSMSPEQADGSPDIDTRTDVYSLGVLLYELLTGARPFDHATLAKAADAEIKRIIREVEPPRPSTRLSSLGEDATAFAERRQAKLDTLAKQLRSELEWIPLKAMRKDRARRYATPLQLKEDVRNYLDGKPLIAGPETRSYRIQKFVKRNRTGVVASVTMLIALITGIALYVHNIRAEQSRTQAALVESEKQRAEAQKQAKIAEDSSNFLANIFRNADPNKSLGAQVTVVQVLDEAIKSLDDGTKATEPVTEAMVRYVVGTTFRALGRFDEALAQLRKARELDRKYRSPTDTQIPVTMSDLATVLRAQDKLVEAEPIYREVLAYYESRQPPDEINIARSLNLIASVLRDQEKFDQAEQMLRRVVEIRRRLLKSDDPDIPNSLNQLAAVLWQSGRLADAETISREVLQVRQATLPPEHPHVSQSLHNLAAVLRDQKKFNEAEPFVRNAVEIRRKVLPPDHPDLAVALHTLAGVLNGQTKYAEAELIERESLKIRRKALPAEHPFIAASACDLGWLLFMQGNYAEAEPLYREALRLRAVRFGDHAPTTTKTAGFLADLLDQTGRNAEAATVRTKHGVSTTQPAAAPATKPT